MGAATAALCHEVALTPRGSRLATALAVGLGISSASQAGDRAWPLRGLATVYAYPGDAMGGSGRAGCPAEALRRYGRRRLADLRRLALERDGLHVIAMRHPVRCGLEVEVRARGRKARAVVLDRGPFGQLCPGQSWSWALALKPGCRWRGVADLPCDLARFLLPGRGCVRRGVVRIHQISPAVIVDL